MYKSIHKLLAVMLLLVLPLQGLSAVLETFHCVNDDRHKAVVIGAQHHHDGVAHSHESAAPANTPHDEGTPGNETGHFCCNHLYTGAPSVAVLPAPESPFVTVNQTSLLQPPFYPERLLRPPRA